MGIDFHFIVLFCVFLLANGIEALAGFGSTIFTLVIGSFFYPIDQLISYILPINIVLSLWTCILYWKDIHTKEFFKFILPLSFLGFIIGSLSTHLFDEKRLLFIFGLLVVIISIHGLIQLKNTKKTKKNNFHFLFLLGGGFIQGLFASGGPFIVAYINKTDLNKSQIRSTLSFLWLILNIIFCIKLYRAEQINMQTLLVSSQLLPGFILGALLGYLIHNKLSEHFFKKTVYILLLLAGLSRILLSFNN